MKISILGDSISTFLGYNPPEYSYYYHRGLYGIMDQNDTWWGRFIDLCNGQLVMNESWSGSRVTCIPNSGRMFPSACSKERTSNLHFGTESPDIILIYMGVNDWMNGATLKSGSIKQFSGFPELVFETAYRLMLKRVRNNYPFAEVCCISINPAYIPTDRSFVFPECVNGCGYMEYNDVIRAEAELAGARFINAASMGRPYESIDGVHPDKTGMKTLGKLIYECYRG
ncbi:MAG: SGNH/GDSL hydrolase family protein [Eubacterium sp.]|nr:SGNH/GDSL hydrolase family protein [Eubacterium sp.]